MENLNNYYLYSQLYAVDKPFRIITIDPIVEEAEEEIDLKTDNIFNKIINFVLNIFG